MIKQRHFLPDICKSEGLLVLQEHVPRIVESLRPGVKELAQMAVAIMPMPDQQVMAWSGQEA